MAPYIPDLDYIKKTANFLNIKDNAIPSSGDISTAYAQEVLDANVKYVESQFGYYGLALPTDTNNLAVLPARDLISFRTILNLVDSYLNESERSQVWRSKVKDADKAFREASQFYTAQKTKANISSGFVPAVRINTRA